MDDRRVGRVIREVRRHHGWRQQDLADRAGVSQRLISQVELGRLEHVSLPRLRRVGAVLDIQMQVDAWWRAGQAARLLDRGHASLVELVVQELRANDWTTRVELPFNHFGDRGRADVVGWHPPTRTLAIGEVKTRIEDVQATCGAFMVKVRVLPNLLEQTDGWAADRVVRLLILPGSRQNRDRIAGHVATFDAIWPGRTVDARRSIRRPERPPPHDGAIWFAEPGR